MADSALGENSVGSASVEIRVALARLRTDMEEVKRLTRQGADSAARSAARMEQQVGQAGARFKREMLQGAAAVNSLNSALATTGRLATTVFAGVGGAAIASSVVRLADQYTNLSARIRLVISDTESFADVQEDIFRLAQDTRAPIEDLTNLYVRLRQSIAGLGNAEALNISRALAQSLAISGAGPQETAAFLRQISQALASGVLRGDEFNSVMENNARFARLLADNLGVSVGALREMASEGQITADVIRNAIAQGGGSLDGEFANMPLTIAGAFQQLENAAARYVGQTDQGLGASRRFADGISLLADNFDKLADALTIVGAVTVSAVAGRGIERGITQFNAVAESAARAANVMREAAQARQTAVGGELSSMRQTRSVLMSELDEIERRITSTQSAIDRINQARADRMFGPDGSAIDESLRTGQPPRLERQRDPNAIPIPGAPQRAGPVNETERLTAAERDLAEAQRRRFDIQEDLSSLDRTITGHEGRLAAATAEVGRQNTLAAGAMRGFRASIGAVRSAASSLVSFLGGPWGVALAATAAAFVLIRQRAEEAAAWARNVENGLSVIANAVPGVEGSAESMQALADAAREAAEAQRDGLKTVRDMTDAGRDAADVTDLQAQASRALALARREEAIATLRAALADGERLRNRLSEQAKQATDYAEGRRGGFISRNRANELRADANAANAEIRRLDERLPLIAQGLSALEFGLIQVNGASQEAAGGVRDFGGSVTDAIAELVKFARETGNFEEAMRRAGAMGERSAEAIRALLEIPEALAGAEGLADPLLAFEQTLRRLEALREAAGGQQAYLFDDREIAAVHEMNRAARLGIDALEALQRAVERGIIPEDVAQRARESMEWMGEDFNRAREIISSGRSELENVRRELDEIRRLAAAGIFGDAGSIGEEGAAIVDLLERMARAAGSAAEALDILRGTDLPESVDRSEAERRITEAARQGAFDREGRLGYAFRTEDVRDAIADGLYGAFREGDWKEAFAQSLSSVMNNVMRRIAESFANSIADAIINATRGGGGGGGIFGSIITAIFGAQGGGGGGKIPGKALGGDVKGGHGYRINEVGQEVFFPGVSGSVATNRALRNALGAANSPRNVKIQIDAKTDGSVDLKIKASEQRATVNGAQMGAGMVMKTLKSRSTT